MMNRIDELMEQWPEGTKTGDALRELVKEHDALLKACEDALRQWNHKDIRYKTDNQDGAWLWHHGTVSKLEKAIALAKGEAQS